MSAFAAYILRLKSKVFRSTGLMSASHRMMTHCNMPYAWASPGTRAMPSGRLEEAGNTSGWKTPLILISVVFFAAEAYLRPLLQVIKAYQRL